MRGAPPSDRGPTIDDIPAEYFDLEEASCVSQFMPGSPETDAHGEKRRRKRKKSKSSHGYLISDILLKSDEDDGDVIKKMMSRSNHRRGGGGEDESRRYRSDLLDHRKRNEGIPELRKMIENSKKLALLNKRNKERKISQSKDKKEEVKNRTPAKKNAEQQARVQTPKSSNQFSQSHFPTLGSPENAKVASKACRTPASKYKKMSQKQKKRMQQEQAELEQQEKIFGKTPPPNAWGIPKFVNFHFEKIFLDSFVMLFRKA